MWPRAVAACVVTLLSACEADRVAHVDSPCDGIQEPPPEQRCSVADQDGEPIVGWCCWAVAPKLRLGRCEPPGAAVCEGLELGPCVGARTPDSEFCDGAGIDEDCDGEVDEQDAREGEECFGRLGGRGEQRCLGGRLTCGPLPEPETCDARDNDWNGIQDDAVPPVTFYDAPIETLLHKPCRPGVRICRGGQLVTVVEPHYPRPEDCGNGIDDDCNGWPDDVARFSIDVMFVLDMSCSMEGRTDLAALEIRAALDWLPPGSRAGLYLSPDPQNDGRLLLASRLGSTASVAAALDRWLPFRNGSDEPSLLALWMACASDWTAPRRIVLAFMDEAPTGPANEGMPAPDAIAAFCAAQGVTVRVWTEVPAAYRPLDAVALPGWSAPWWGTVPRPIDLLATASCPMVGGP